MPSVILDVGELAEMLTFLSDWLAANPALDASLARAIGHPAYGVRQLRDDLDRFVFLLGGSDGEQFLTDPGGQPAEGEPND